MPQIYFLCTGNSCRSQMAEAFAKKYLPDWAVQSAGIEAHGLNPLTVKVMAERNIDISKNISKVIDSEYLNTSDLVITLCGDAHDRCPMTPPQVKKEHWDFIDPAKISGTDEEILAGFRMVRDEMEERIIEFSRIKNVY